MPHSFYWLKDSRHRWLLLILSVGLVLRLWQIGYGLPRVYFTDEEFFTAPALRIADGSWNPGWFGAPASPQIYAIGLTWRVQNAMVNAAHGTHLSASQNEAEQVGSFFVVARLWSVFLGMVGLWALYAIGRRVSESVGLWAAALGATNWYLIEQSHIIRPDIWQTTFLLLTLWAVLQIVEKSNVRRWYVLVGIFFGLAISEKYPAVLLLLLLPVLVWILRKRGDLIWRHLWLAAGVATLTIFLAAPYIFLHPYQAMKDIGYEILQPHNIHSDRGVLGNVQLYIQSLDWQLGTLLSLVLLGVFALTRRKKIFSDAAGAALLMALVYFISLSLTRQAWDRWMIPVATMLLLPMAAGIENIWSRKKTWLTTLIIVLCLAAPTLRLVRLMVGLGRPYSSEIVRSWFLRNVPHGAKIVSDPYGPTLPLLYDVARVGTVGGTSVAQFRQQGTQYVVATQDILTALKGMAARKNVGGSYQNAADGYAKISAAFPMATTTLPASGQTNETTLWANDFFIFKTLALDVPRGSVYTVYAVR